LAGKVDGILFFGDLQNPLLLLFALQRLF